MILKEATRQWYRNGVKGTMMKTNSESGTSNGGKSGGHRSRKKKLNRHSRRSSVIVAAAVGLLVVLAIGIQPHATLRTVRLVLLEVLDQGSGEPLGGVNIELRSPRFERGGHQSMTFAAKPISSRFAAKPSSSGVYLIKFRYFHDYRLPVRLFVRPPKRCVLLLSRDGFDDKEVVLRLAPWGDEEIEEVEATLVKIASPNM